MPEPKPSKKTYSWKRGLGGFLAKTGREVAFGPKVPKGQNKGGGFSSEYFGQKKPYMQLYRAEQIMSGMSGAQGQKMLAKLRLRTKVQDPKWAYEPNFSQREKTEALKEITSIFGEKVAKEVEKKWGVLFQGKSSVTGKEALQRLGMMSEFGPDAKEGIPLIIKKYDQKPQLGRGAKYVTEEKVGEVIEETKEKSGKYAAQALRKSFRAKEEKPDGAKKALPRNSFLAGWARRQDSGEPGSSSSGYKKAA